MTDDERLGHEVRDLFRYQFAATAEDVAEALGIDVGHAVRLMRRLGLMTSKLRDANAVYKPANYER